MRPVAPARLVAARMTCSDEELLHRARHRGDHLVIFVLDVVDEGFLQFTMRLRRDASPTPSARSTGGPDPRADGTCVPWAAHGPSDATSCRCPDHVKSTYWAHSYGLPLHWSRRMRRGGHVPCSHQLAWPIPGPWGHPSSIHHSKGDAMRRIQGSPWRRPGGTPAPSHSPFPAFRALQVSTRFSKFWGSSALNRKESPWESNHIRKKEPQEPRFTLIPRVSGGFWCQGPVLVGPG